MNRTATAILTIGSFLFVFAAEAQPVRNGVDVVFARDVAGAEITLDGMPNEAVWQQAETLEFVWGTPPGGEPGASQRVEGNPTLVNPPDSADGTMRILRDGNLVWIAWEVRDESVGGNTSLWDFDGMIMTITDRTRRPDTVHQVRRRGNWHGRTEWIASFWSPTDTTDGTTTYANGDPIPSGRTVPGDPIRGFGDYGVGFGQGRDGDARSPEDMEIWDFASAMMGSSVSNDDTHGPDEGYYMEMFIDVGALGYDFTQPEGDKVPLSVALQDSDYLWPNNPDSAFIHRVAFQNEWANNFNNGIGFLYGVPGVDVNSGDLPVITEPEAQIYHVGELDAPTIDGVLDEDVWMMADTMFFLKYRSTTEELDRNPSLLPWNTSWWLGDPDTTVVVDPTEGRFKLTFDGPMLYVGLDTDDQAINGLAGDVGRDGFTISLKHIDSLKTNGTLYNYEFNFSIDSTGAMRYSGAAADAQMAGAIEGALSLKGASTVADPSGDPDEGYSMEVAIDLSEVAGYPADAGNSLLWMTLKYYDGDALEAADDSYGTFTWFLGERPQGGNNPPDGGASLPVYLNGDIAVGISDEFAEIPAGIRIESNYPNPFSGSTMLAYTLPQAGDVKISVFNVLGQKVAEIDGGAQGAGDNRFEFKPNGLSAGLYLYRVELLRASDGEVRHSAVGNMLIAK